MRMLTAGGLLVLAAAAHADQVELRPTEAGRVSLKVTSAPLSEVLDRLARQTGMKVVYEGAPPRTLVRARQIDDVTPAAAVSDVLEGLGVSYALRLDPTGAKVDTLLVLSATKTAGAAGAAGGRPASRTSIPPVRLPGLANMPEPDEEDGDEEVTQERPEEMPAETRPGQERPDITRPVGAGMPIPGVMGIPGQIPGAPALPVNPIIGPLSMPTPSTMPSPTPPPQLQQQQQ